MIRLSNIYYRYPDTQDGWVLEGIDLTVKEGEYVLLCGESGSGKSTLGYLFNGLIPHFFGGVLKGSVSVDGLDIREMRVSDLLPKVGVVFQNADAQLFNSTVEKEIAFGLESLGLSARRIGQQIQQITDKLHIEDLLDRSPVTLSGGEKRLAAIACVLCLNPDVLLLDEPFAHLDWDGTWQVRKALSHIHQSGKTVVVIEHRVGPLLEEATRCVILGQGKLLFDGSPQDAQPILLREHILPRYTLKRTPERFSSDPVLAAQGLSYKIEKRAILKGISLDLKEGEALAIVGRNGSGKTTLIKHFNGLLRPAEGKLTLMGQEIEGKPPSELASSVGISFQNPNDQFFKSRVNDELLVGVKAMKKRSHEWIEEMVALFGLNGLLDRSPYRLSEGEKKRVALASIAAIHPKILVLDEPTVGQDGRFLEVISGLLLSLQARGFTIVIVTHDLDFALATAERWIVLHEGRMVGHGSPLELSGNEPLIDMGALDRQGLSY